ncbi:MAG: polysaccharide biosynthesis protein, partial [Ramlibacter sp.]
MTSPTSRFSLQPIKLAIDVGLVGLAWLTAFWFRFNFDIPDPFLDLAWKSAPWAMVGFVLGLQAAGVYRQVWRYFGLLELQRLVVGVCLGGLIAAATILALRMPNFPRSVLALHPMLALLLLGAVRAAWRIFNERPVAGEGTQARRLLIVGSLHDSSDALRALK